METVYAPTKLALLKVNVIDPPVTAIGSEELATIVAVAPVGPETVRLSSVMASDCGSEIPVTLIVEDVPFVL